MVNEAPSRRTQGFTLIELLIIVVIISTMASIVVPNLFNFGDQSRIIVANNTVIRMQKKIDAFRELNGTWPDAIDPGWFVSKRYPRSPYSPNYSGNSVYADTREDKWHPYFKSLETYSPFWYSKVNGSFRIRVPKQSTDALTLALYNKANMSDVSNIHGLEK